MVEKNKSNNIDSIIFPLLLIGSFYYKYRENIDEKINNPYFLVFIGVVLGVSLALLIWKGPQFRGQGKIENLFSLEVLFLFNNLLLVSFCFVVFLGTLYPLVVEAIRGERISVGQH